MENCTGNSNCTGMDKGEFKAFGILIPAMGVLLFVLSEPTIIALYTARTIAQGLKAFLMSALLSGILVNSSNVLTGLIALVTVYSGAPAPPHQFCRFMLWVSNICTLTRSFSVAGYSVMVLIVVRYGKKNMKLLYIILSLCIVWGVSFLLTLQYQVPQVYAAKFLVGAVCLPSQDDTIFIEARLFFTVFTLVIITFTPLVVCIVVPIIVLRYIKKHSVTDCKNNNKAVAKLGLFLLTGSLMNSTGITVVSVLAYFTVGFTELVYCVYIIAILSLFPTPILIITFLKPIRDKIKVYLLKCRCLWDKSEKSVSTANTSVQ